MKVVIKYFRISRKFIDRNLRPFVLFNFLEFIVFTLVILHLIYYYYKWINLQIYFKFHFKTKLKYCLIKTV